MNRPIKLLILIILSLSVYFIYNYTNNKTIKITYLGDNPKTIINLRKKQIINTKYTSKEIKLDDLIEKIKTTPEIKKDLLESHILIISVGYNDLIYKLSLYNNTKFNKINNEIIINYNELIKEIRKYYKNKIIVIGYNKSNNDNYYLNIGIRKLNNYLKNNKNITYINTYNLSNKAIENKIIQEILAK